MGERREAEGWSGWLVFVEEDEVAVVRSFDRGIAEGLLEGVADVGDEEEVLPPVALAGVALALALDIVDPLAGVCEAVPVTAAAASTDAGIAFPPPPPVTPPKPDTDGVSSSPAPPGLKLSCRFRGSG